MDIDEVDKIILMVMILKLSTMVKDSKAADIAIEEPEPNEGEGLLGDDSDGARRRRFD